MLKRLLYISILLFVSNTLDAQVTTTPICFNDQEEISIVYDATLGTSGLVGASKVYIHAGVITESYSGTTWEHVVGNWGVDDGIGQMSRVAGEDNKWQITLTPRLYFNVPSEETVYRLGMVFRNADGSKEGKSDADGDIFINLSYDGVNLQLSEQPPLLVNNGENVLISASTCSAGTFTLLVDEEVVHQTSGSSNFNYSYTIQQQSGELVTFQLTADVGGASNTKVFYTGVRSATIEEPRPQNIVDGINYNDADNSSVTLSLWAPQKSAVYVVGDFTDWAADPNYQMKKDGEHYWLEINGLTPGMEYGYQYWVDESLYIADPYADKILDPDDKWISSSTYPGLKSYPEESLREAWYENRVAVLQTNQTPYTWQNTEFEKPAEEKLIIYELLVRDFLGEHNMNYQALIDTLDYLEGLGVNAIELMPIMEFNGNDSWGYNPTFMFAVDKAYGTKNDLKDFVDECHGRGIAVILDMVMNQNDIPSPYAAMYFDFVNWEPTSDNPWFNQVPKHPFNVFSDINHESEHTKVWLDTINHYWLNEFKFDGYRFDLSKGFTQTNTFPDDVAGWGNRDDSRIALLKRMADKIWEHTPDAYVILEHFANNDEERILADYGMMLWGNHMYDYSEAAMGYANGKSIGGAYYENRGWNKNGLIAYMESHDEERQMVKLQESGNSAGAYDTKELTTALQRLKLAATFFFTVPGPKMLWQFGEFGYDVSIDFNGRTGRKPTKWEYLEDIRRQHLLEVYKELISLRHQYDIFTEGDFTWQPDGNFKTIHITRADTNVVIIGNFDVQEGEINPLFQHTGTWYDFFSGGELEVNNVTTPIQLGAGEFHIYTDKQLHKPDYHIITSIEEDDVSTMISIYPNPASEFIKIRTDKIPGKKATWEILDVMGRPKLSGELNSTESRLNLTSLQQGIYLITVSDGRQKVVYKFIRD